VDGGILMRNATWIVLTIAITGCQYPELPKLTSGGDASVDDASMTGSDGPSGDAMIDAPHTCYVPAMLGTLTLGTQANPVVRNWFSVPTSGPNAGKTTFSIGGTLSSQAPVNIVVIDVAKSGNNFMTNQPYVFSTDANPTLAFVARAYVLGDYDTANSTWKQYLYSANGSITFTQIAEAPGSSINGSVTMTDFREVNETTGAVIAGGCTSQFAGMTFYLTQMAP
jgi:hypothetical protein